MMNGDDARASGVGSCASVSGLEMYYEVHGVGQPLVLLHGALAAIGTSFGKVLPSLAETRQVIAIEQQAHGHTAGIDRPLSYEQMADDTAALLRHIGIESADVFGWSMGGGIALQIAIRHPEVVRKLVSPRPPTTAAEFTPGSSWASDNSHPKPSPGPRSKRNTPGRRRTRKIGLR